MSESRLQTALAVIPVVSAGLYLLGFTYHQGYLEGFGIEDSLFPLATDRSLLFGFFAFVTFGLVPMVYALFAVVLLFSAVLVAAVLSSTPLVKDLQAKVVAKLRSWRSKNEPSPTLSTWVDKGGTAYGYAAGSFLVVLMLIVVAVLAGKSGKAQAQKDIEAFTGQAGSWVVLHTAILPSPARAKQIVCSTSHCAFWLGSEALILRHESIERIVAHNQSFQGALRDEAAQRH